MRAGRPDSPALPFVARAVVDALREFPMLNATVDADGDALTVHRAVHLGIAVDLDFKGLVVPVVHDADGLRLARARGRDPRRRRRVRAPASSRPTISRAARSRSRTRARRARGSRSRSSTGRRSASSRPTASRKQVVADDEGRLRIAPIGHLCLSFDHRALDGAYAGAFLGRVREIIETRDWFGEL